MFTSQWLLQGVMRVIPLVLWLTVHEWAHAYTAFRLGDDTAAREGRLTLNPLPHIDLIGTILAPLMGVPFGWAKPVPIVPARFRRDVSMSTGTMIATAAGPLSNLLLAVICTVLYGLLLRFALVQHGEGLGQLLMIGITQNLMLFLFNFFPVPPLDGSRVVDGLIPYRFRGQWEQFTRYSWIALLLVIYFGGALLQGPLSWLEGRLDGVLWVIVGR
jgi:Zn-dependent protease